MVHNLNSIGDGPGQTSCCVGQAGHFSSTSLALRNVDVGALVALLVFLRWAAGGPLAAVPAWTSAFQPVTQYLINLHQQALQLSLSFEESTAIATFERMPTLSFPHLLPNASKQQNVARGSQAGCLVAQVSRIRKRPCA